MPGSCFTYDPHHWSIFFGLVGFAAGLCAVLMPRRKPVVRITDWHTFDADDLMAVLRQGGAL